MVVLAGASGQAGHSPGCILWPSLELPLKVLAGGGGVAAYPNFLFLCIFSFSTVAGPQGKCNEVLGANGGKNQKEESKSAGCESKITIVESRKQRKCD